MIFAMHIRELRLLVLFTNTKAQQNDINIYFRFHERRRKRERSKGVKEEYINVKTVCFG